MEIELSLPYLSKALPGIGGRLKSEPAHFEVTEIPLYEASGEGQHLYINLTKEGLTSREVQQHLARIFKVANKDVSFAGMKDKHARTTQTFSLWVGHVDAEFVEQAGARIEAETAVQVNWVQLHANKLRRGHLLGNRFSITVSDLDLSGEEALDRCKAIRDALQETGLPNFYGVQRLGREGANVERGLELLQGHRTLGDRWLRNLLLASVQSYLCNRYLIRRLQEVGFDNLLLGDIAKKYDSGGLFEVEDLSVDQQRYLDKEISFTAPIFGPKMWQTGGPAGGLEDAVLHQAGLSIEQFAAARMAGTRRLGRLLLTDLDVETVGPDVCLHFSLPKGGYATNVLREFMKVDDGELEIAAGADED